MRCSSSTLASLPVAPKEDERHLDRAEAGVCAGQSTPRQHQEEGGATGTPLPNSVRAGAKPLNSRWARARGGRTWRPSFTPSTSSTSRTTGSTVCARPPQRSTQPSRGDGTAENAGETAREGRHLRFLQRVL